MKTHDDEDEPMVDRVPGLERLTMEREPSRDLWSGIEARLQAKAPPLAPRAAVARPRRRSWLPMAAAASFTAAVATLMTLQLNKIPVKDQGGAAALMVATAEPAADAPAARKLLRENPVAVVEARAVPASWQAASSTLRKQNRGLIKANLKLVDNAEAQLRRAMAEDPQSAYLERLLLTTQDQQQNLHQLLDKTHR